MDTDVDEQPRKRGRTNKAVKAGLAARFADDATGAELEFALMEKFRTMVDAKCRSVYPEGVTEELVRNFPILEMFVHRVPFGSLIREDKSWVQSE